MTTLEALNALSVDDFVATIGFAFEDSPWIARAAANARPFSSLDALHAALLDVVTGAGPERVLALIAAHPDLAGRVAREGRLTPASRDEQAGAGLDRLTPEETAHFERANALYRARFGFPFVICVREHDKGSILAALDARSAHERSAEIVIAWAEIAKIARLRLEDAIHA